MPGPTPRSANTHSSEQSRVFGFLDEADIVAGGNSQEIPQVGKWATERNAIERLGWEEGGVCTLYRTVRDGLSEKLVLVQPMRSIWGKVLGEMVSAKALGPCACWVAGTAG